LQSLPTAKIAEELPEGIGVALASLMASISEKPGPLAAAGIGIAGSVDPGSGVVTRAFLQEHWVGKPMRDLLHRRLACPVVLEQDDHLSVLAEVSNRGTVPGASSVVEINYGRGICAGVVAGGQVIKGARGWAGRIMYWPSDWSSGLTLRQELPPDAMLAAYRAGGGSHPAADGAGLCELARAGDPAAEKVVSRAATILAGVFLRLATTIDPEYMVLGGGFAGSFDLFEKKIRETLSVLPHPPHVLPTAIGSDAVVIGGLLAADRFIDHWLADRIADCLATTDVGTSSRV
jgi:glucokinase